MLNCTPYNFQGIQKCEAGIDSRVALIIVKVQRNTQWCWAAWIVQQTRRGLVNNPEKPEQIVRSSNRPWMDLTGQGVYVSGDTYSANHVTASQDLSNNIQLIIGTTGHAIVLTSVQYIRDQYGQGYVTGAIVRDPWENRGKRSPTGEEWDKANFLVRIRIPKF